MKPGYCNGATGHRGVSAGGVKVMGSENDRMILKAKDEKSHGRPHQPGQEGPITLRHCPMLDSLGSKHCWYSHYNFETSRNWRYEVGFKLIIVKTG